MNEWQPIETAPTDGRHVLVWCYDIYFVAFLAGAGWVVNAPGLPLAKRAPTHWMPLPPPPEDT